MTARPMVVAMACRNVAASPESPAAAYDEKKIGYTAVTMIVTMAELAQSYMAQARCSRVLRPRRARRPSPRLRAFTGVPWYCVPNHDMPARCFTLLA